MRALKVLPSLLNKASDYQAVNQTEIERRNESNWLKSPF